MLFCSTIRKKKWNTQSHLKSVYMGSMKVYPVSCLEIANVFCLLPSLWHYIFYFPPQRHDYLTANVNFRVYSYVTYHSCLSLLDSNTDKFPSCGAWLEWKITNDRNLDLFHLNIIDSKRCSFPHLNAEFIIYNFTSLPPVMSRQQVVLPYLGFQTLGLHSWL